MYFQQQNIRNTHTEFSAYGQYCTARQSPVILTCDHALPFLPPESASLGLSASKIYSHAGWDIGALRCSRRIADILYAPLLYTVTSRLYIDCNRPLDSPVLIPESLHGFTVPGNIDLTEQQKNDRIKSYFMPYHKAVTDLMRKTADSFTRPLYFAVHSFTPQLNGQSRPWDIGILFSSPSKQSRYLIDACRKAGFTTGINQPYTVDPDSDYGMIEHGEKKGIPAVMIEIRQDHLSDYRTWKRFSARFFQIVSGIPL